MFVTVVMAFLVVFLYSGVVSLTDILYTVLCTPCAFTVAFVFSFVVCGSCSLACMVFSATTTLLVNIFIVMGRGRGVGELLGNRRGGVATGGWRRC